MASPSGPDALVGELAAHPHVDALAARVSSAALQAAEARQRELAAKKDGSGGNGADLTRDQAETRLGNPLELLERGAQRPEEWELLSTLVALGISKLLPSAPESELELAGQLVWLATHTPCDALSRADAALGSKAPALWRAVARLVEEPALGGPDFGRAETLVAAAAVRASSSAVAGTLRRELAAKLEDPLVRELLRDSELPLERRHQEPGDEQTHEGAQELAGELAPAPRGPLTTALLAFTLLLFVVEVGRLLGRYALSYRRPALLRLSERGLELEHRTELLGKVLRERKTLMPLSALSSVTREVRYSRAGLYAGLVALTIGTYLGMGLLVDGVRVPGGSPPLLGLAVLLIVLGLAIDYGLSSVADSARGKCRIIVVPRKGRKLCVGDLDQQRADAMLRAVRERTRVHL